MSKNRSRIKIADIAEAAGVSTATVSYVLNKKSGRMKISPETAAKVRDTASKMGYEGDFFARSLRRQRSHTIGILLADLEYGWADRVLEGINDVLADSEYAIYFAVHHWNRKTNVRELDRFLSRRVEAIIAQPVPRGADDYARALHDDRCKLVFLGNRFDELPHVSSVAWDSEIAAYDCTQRLIQLGKRRIAFVGAGRPSAMALDRYRGYSKALADAGLTPNPAYVVWKEAGTLAADDVARLIALPERERPDGVFFIGDRLAIDALPSLYASGLRIPQDIACAGMGNLVFSSHPMISLSSMEEPTRRMGKEAAALALELVNNAKAPKTILLDHLNFIERNTTMMENRGGQTKKAGETVDITEGSQIA